MIGTVGGPDRCVTIQYWTSVLLTHHHDTSVLGRIIPIYDYSCQACQHQFEALILKGENPECPSCGSTDLERLISAPAVQSESTRDLAMRAAKRRDEKQGKERMWTQRQYELNHDD